MSTAGKFTFSQFALADNSKSTGITSAPWALDRLGLVITLFTKMLQRGRKAKTKPVQNKRFWDGPGHIAGCFRTDRLLTTNSQHWCCTNVTATDTV